MASTNANVNIQKKINRLFPTAHKRSKTKSSDMKTKLFFHWKQRIQNNHFQWMYINKSLFTFQEQKISSYKNRTNWIVWTAGCNTGHKHNLKSQSHKITVYVFFMQGRFFCQHSNRPKRPEVESSLVNNKQKSDLKAVKLKDHLWNNLPFK